jgi:hypothetical protein
MFNLQQIDVTGCRIIGAITKELGHSGPKHHGVILGLNLVDGQTYIAESRASGYGVCTVQEFESRYSQNGEIIISPNDGDYENILVVKRALDELNRGGERKYNLITNNCECFVNRAMRGSSTSQQIINTAIGALVILGLVYVIKKSK